MLDVPGPAGGGGSPERDEDGPLWRHALGQVVADLLAALDRHWIGAVWGASAACWGIGLALDARHLVVFGQMPVMAAMIAAGVDWVLDAYAVGWQVAWRPPSRWRLGWVRGTVAIHRAEGLRLVPGTRFWEEIPSARVERAGPGVCIGPLEVSRRHPSPWTGSGTVARDEGGHDA